jgi:hypothetical protein
MSGMRPFIHVPRNLFYLYLSFIQCNYLNACVYIQNIPFGQMIDSQRLLSLSLVLVKPSIIWISSSLLSAIYNCQDVFRKNSQNGIAQDWQTMRRIFEEIWSNRVIDTISQVIDMLFSRPYSNASLIMLGLLRGAH